LPGHPFEHPENCINVYINFLQNWKFQNVEVRKEYGLLNISL